MTDWQRWSHMPSFIDSAEGSALVDSSCDNDTFYAAEKEYEDLVRNRISWLESKIEGMLTADRAEAHFVLASLYDILNFERPPAIFKREVRYNCIKAVRLNPEDHRAWDILALACSWVSVIGKSRGLSIQPIKIVGIYCTTPGGAQHHESEFESHEDEAPSEYTKKRARFALRWAEKAVRYMRRALSLLPAWPRYRKHLYMTIRERGIRIQNPGKID